MTAIIRPAKLALLVLALAAAGCRENAGDQAASAGAEPQPTASSTPGPSTIPGPTPDAVAEPAAAQPEATPPAKDAGAGTPKPQAAADTPKPADPEGAVKLDLVTFDQFQARMARKDGKYTVVDVWATWCGPCKENFPHLVEMNKKYGGKSVTFASLSFDDPAEAKQVHAAQEFLAAKQAEFPNYLLNEEQGVGNEKLDVNAIPAVFVFGSDGKIVKRFTWDDPNNQFTYDDVEKAVVALVEGKPLPKDRTSPAESK